MNLSAIVAALAAAAVFCNGSGVARYLGHWNSVNKDSSYVDINQTPDGIIVKQRNMGQAEVTIKALVTVDGKLVVPIKGSYAVILYVNDQTGELNGGEQQYKKSSH